MLEASAQTQFERVANAERIDRAYGYIRRSEIYIGGKMIDGVDPLTQRVELFCGKTELSLADVADHDAYARSKGFVPDFSLLQGGLDTLEAMFGVIGPDQAMDHYIGILLQKVAQDKTPDESVRPGQQNLSKISRGYSIGWCSLAHRRVNESAQVIKISLAIWRQRTDEWSHHPVGDFFSHIFSCQYSKSEQFPTPPPGTLPVHSRRNEKIP